MISAVVPVFNEEESLLKFYGELTKSLKELKRGYEIVFVDDGSTDRTLSILKEITKKDTQVKIYSFRKNQGKAEALTYGFKKAQGDLIVTLDADLQDKPSEIKKLLDKADEGWEVVCGWRKERKDPFKKIASSRVFNYFAGIFWGLHLHDYNCGLKLYTKDAARSLYLYGGMHRFIPILVFQQGFTVTEASVVHDERKFGKSKYGFSKLWKDLPDIFTMLFLTRYSSRPLHFFGTVGSLFLFIGLIMLLYLSILHFQGEAIGRRPLLTFGMLFVLGGFQVIFTGFLADLILNISHRKEQHVGVKFVKE